MIYYTTYEKRQEMEDKAIYAVETAIKWLENDQRKNSKE